MLHTDRVKEVAERQITRAVDVPGRVIIKLLTVAYGGVAILTFDDGRFVLLEAEHGRPEDPCSEISIKRDVNIYDLQLLKDAGVLTSAEVAEERAVENRLHGAERELQLRRQYLLSKAWFEFGIRYDVKVRVVIEGADKRVGVVQEVYVDLEDSQIQVNISWPVGCPNSCVQDIEDLEVCP